MEESERVAAGLAVVRGESPALLDPTESPVGAYDRVVRIVSWVFILATSTIVAVTGLWPATQPAIFALLAAAGLFVLVVHDLLPPSSLGSAKFVVEGSVAITFATLLVLLTGGNDSPFFFTFPLIVGGAALVVSPRVTFALATIASLGYLFAVAAPGSGPIAPVVVAKVGINLTALILLAYVAMVIAREQRRSRDAAIRLSTIDPLTGLFNRTFFFAAVDREIARSARSNRGFCLLMMDLDELKTINDRHGHFFGDRVLRGVGEVIRSGVRQDRHGRPLRRRRVRRPPAGDRSDRRLRPRREGPDRRDRARHRRRRVGGGGVDLGRGRQLSRRRPDERRAADQRRPGDVRLKARRQEPGHGLPDRRRRLGRRLGVASGHAGARAAVTVATPNRPAGFSTRAIRAAHRSPVVDQRPTSVPIYQASRSPAPTPPSSAPCSPTSAPATPKRGSTTRRSAALAAAVAELEGAEAGYALASGMAAIHAALVSLVSAGDRIVATQASYGTTRSLLSDQLRRLGVTTEFVDVTDLAAVEAALAAAPTRVLYAETIANPTIVVADHAALAELAHRHGALYVVDNTFASPYLCRPIELGADLVIESATKYLSGHSDVLAGVVAGRRDLVEGVRRLQVDTGATLAPNSAFLVLRGIATLAVRMERHATTAAALAAWLERQGDVTRVYHPSLAEPSPARRGDAPAARWAAGCSRSSSPAAGPPAPRSSTPSRSPS